jgi:hypothetical protein
MGLAALVRSSAKAAFAAVGDVKEQVTYRRRTSTTYNTTTGLPADTGPGDILVSMVLSDADAGEKPQGYQNNEPRTEEFNRKGLLLQSALSFEPKEEDMIILSSGVKYLVLKVDQDPARATWTLWLKITVAA